LCAKMGYIGYMFRSVLIFALRLSLVAAIWALVWQVVEPRTQLMRIMRAALLLLGILGVLAVVRLIGP
jgi:hypothetical protein